MSRDRPLERLRAIAASGASGEFICASPSSETHVYLQNGRIAWATDSQTPFAFATHLQRDTGIDADTFSHVVEECRRERLPLGETLVEWGLATRDTVRASLAHQIADAMAVLDQLDSAQTLFLGRKYGDYDDHLTFDLCEFIGESGAPRAGRRQAVPGIQAAVLTDRDDLAQQLRGTVEGLAWVEIYEGDRIVDSDPPSETPVAPQALMRSTLLDGADFMALRSARGSVVGSRFSESRSLWCGVATGSTFGSVLAAVGSLAVANSLEGPPARSDGVAWSLGDVGGAVAAELRSFMQGAEDVLATLTLHADPAVEPVAAFGAAGTDADRCLQTARRRALTFTPSDEDPAPGPETSGALGFYLRTMVSGEGDLWCFGAELGAPAQSTVWLFADRRNAQGLGWAYLSALTRALARLRTEADG